jgi:hypothetical protein
VLALADNLEQTGKLKSRVEDDVNALAEAIRAGGRLNGTRP